MSKPAKNPINFGEWKDKQRGARTADLARMLGKTHAGMAKIIRRYESGVDYRVEQTPEGPKLWIKQSPWKAV